VYNNCAQRYAHKYQQLLNLYLVRFRLVFVFFCKGLICIFVLVWISLVFVVLVLLVLVFSVLSRDIGLEDRLQNDLFCVEQDIKLN